MNLIVKFHRERLINLSILLSPVAVCLIIFPLNGIKQNLILRTDAQVSSLILTFYTTNFVHYTFNHLSSNLFNYTIFGVLSLRIYELLNLNKIYRYSIIAILLLVPFLNSLYSYLFFSLYNIGGSIYGFSAVTSAIMGMYAVGVILTICSDEKDIIFGYLFVLLASFFFFTLTYSSIVYSLFFLVLSLLSFTAIVYRHRKEPPRKFFIALILVAIYLFNLGAIFPKTLVEGGSVTNILGHISGLVLGILIPYMVSLRLKYTIDGLRVRAGTEL
jgi:hypothetical protein